MDREQETKYIEQLLDLNKFMCLQKKERYEDLSLSAKQKKIQIK